MSCELAKKCNSLAANEYNDVFQPDCKTQVTVTYDDNKLVDIDTVLISISSYEGISQDEIKKILMNEIIEPLASQCRYFTSETRVIINPSGAFTIAGPFGDSGTTGRKIVVDTYGGYAPIGGGCFSSKDPSKVDRSGAYYARYVAKNLVAHNLCDKVQIQVAYGIGIAKPISLTIDCFGTNKKSMAEIYDFVNANFDFSVANMIDELQLRTPNYSNYVCYGAFTHQDASWEQIKQF